MFIYNKKEKEIAEALGVAETTIKNWRNNGTLPDFCYRFFGASHKPTLRYSLPLVVRWQAGLSPSEELKIREQLIKELELEAVA